MTQRIYQNTKTWGGNRCNIFEHNYLLHLQELYSYSEPLKILA